MFWFIVFLLILGAVFYFYQKMSEIEREIRAGEEIVKKTEPEPPRQEDSELDTVPPVVSDEVKNMAARAEPVADEPLTLEDEILGAVINLPGVRQTELYDSFADVNRKKLQQLLKEMEESGKIRREKQGSSYQLFPL
jgi:hypothetical protein